MPERRPEVLQQRVSAFLSERASSLHSRTLSLLATKVAADPFEKVKKMIKVLGGREAAPGPCSVVLARVFVPPRRLSFPDLSRKCIL